MKIVVSGASGFIGRRVVKTFVSAGHSVAVLSRHAGMNMPAGVKVFTWNPAQGEPPADALRDADAVVHLAGEPVAQRWNEAVKARIRDSRVLGTENLVKAIGKLDRKPPVLVSGSAIGYYGERGDEVLTEDSSAGSDFLAQVCTSWEAAARQAEPWGVRVVCVRTGHVLEGKGGLLKRILPPFRLGLGGRLSTGKQWMSWIHLDDMANLIRFAVEKPVTGTLNGVAPAPVTNAEFTRVLAGALHRPAVFPVPKFALKVMFGEMADVILSSQRVLPKAAERAGFQFEFPELGPAMKNLFP